MGLLDDILKELIGLLGLDDHLDKLPKALGGAEPQVGPAFRNFLEVASDTARGLADRYLATDAMLLALANAQPDAPTTLPGLAGLGLDDAGAVGRAGRGAAVQPRQRPQRALHLPGALLARPLPHRERRR